MTQVELQERDRLLSGRDAEVERLRRSGERAKASVVSTGGDIAEEGSDTDIVALRWDETS